MKQTDANLAQEATTGEISKKRIEKALPWLKASH